MSLEGDQSWRRHEVPTFTQVEDTWFLGLGLKQIMGVIIALSVAFAIYQFVSFSFLPSNVRIGLAFACGIIGVGFVVVRPGGRSIFSLALDLIRFMMRAKEYCEDLEELISVESLDDAKRRVEEDKREADAEAERLARAERGEEESGVVGGGLKGGAMAMALRIKGMGGAALARAPGLINRTEESAKREEEEINAERTN